MHLGETWYSEKKKEIINVLLTRWANVGNLGRRRRKGLNISPSAEGAVIGGMSATVTTDEFVGLRGYHLKETQTSNLPVETRHDGWPSREGVRG